MGAKMSINSQAIGKSVGLIERACYYTSIAGVSNGSGRFFNESLNLQLGVSAS